MKIINNEKKIKLKEIIRNSIQPILFSIVGMIIGSISIGYAATIYFNSDKVSYDNTNSQLPFEEVESALDALEVSTKFQQDIINYVNAYNSLGERIAAEPNEVSVANDTKTRIAQITLTPGRWIINGNANFTSNATGHRRVYLAYSSSCPDTEFSAAAHTIVPAVNGQNTRIGFTSYPYDIADTSGTIYLCAYQNSGSAIGTTGRLYAMKIK
ncbi:MAG: hypothetical protein IJ097_00855 [Bacilli bacterium]|nr:hypothetical protein [Bacilli bacterium]